MANLADALGAELATLALARAHFPMWLEWGVADESVAVHSLGLTYLTTIGQSLGYACCSEYPVDGHRIRADSVWWDKQTRKAVALFEFERRKDGDELREKVKNLLRAHHAAGQTPQILGLVYWSKHFYPSADDLRDLWRIFERGFETAERARVPPAPQRLLRVYECMHESAGSGRHMLKSIIERRRS